MKHFFKVLLLPWLLFTVVVDIVLKALIDAIHWFRKESAGFQVWLMRLTDDDINEKCIAKEKSRAETKKAHDRIRSTDSQIFRLWADGAVEGPDDFDEAKTLKYDDYVNVMVPSDVVNYIGELAVFDYRGRFKRIDKATDLDTSLDDKAYQDKPNRAQTPNLEA